MKDIDFRRVDYDVESELQLARDLKLPYYEVYYESLVNGIHHTHNQDLLHEIAQSQGHDVELDDWLSPLTLDITTLGDIINIREE